MSAAAGDPSSSAAQMIEVYLRGYADRPALGHRRSDSFDVITYRQFHSLINCLRARWSAPDGGELTAGDFVATLGFTSADYAVVDLACTLSGLVTVPLHNTFDAHQIVPILRETAPRLLAVSVESLPVAIAALAEDSAVERVVVFDYVPDDDKHRSLLGRARTRLSAVRPELTLTSLPDEIAAGKKHAPPPVYVPEDEDTLATIIYTSGSTGTPKGAMFPTSWIKHYWQRSVGRPDPTVPALHLQNLPLSFLGGRQWLASTLSNGGTGYFTAGSDNSTFLEDLTLVRPTELVMVPKLCGEIFRLFQSEESRLLELGIDQAAATAAAMQTIRVDVLGGRVVTACCGGAPLSTTIRDFVQSCLGIQVVDGYGSTEAGTTVTENGWILQPPVVDYKLVDVPESGYTNADRPHPRGELYIKSICAFSGYYKRPEDTADVFDADGFYKTGDIMAEVAPGRLSYIDRASNILKLAAVGFVSVSKLEAMYSGTPELRQIYIYGNSAQPFLLAVVVPNQDLVDPENGKEKLSAALRQVATDNALASYEIPRDFIVEQQEFTRTNGLLSSSGKLLRPALKERYESRLESLYNDL
ncbi:AMP-binding protein [Nocardia sp. NPDC056541]|uniref:AMP-binding protein n=1 Tax=Nocardia sp. NPDC056541 TaxID=3345860 RepID=UPI003672744F